MGPSPYSYAWDVNRTNQWDEKELMTKNDLQSGW